MYIPTCHQLSLRSTPNGSIQNPRFNQAILFVVVRLVSSHSLLHIKFAWEAVQEAFFKYGQTIEAEISRFGEVATRCREIHKLQCYEVCQTQ